MGGLFGGGGGGSAPSTPSATSQNVTTSNIAPWAQSGVSDLINAGMGQVFQTNPDGTINTNQMKGYTPFNANTPAGNEWVQGAAGSVAGFSPLQQQAQQNIANMQTPSQYGQAMDMSTMAGLGALDTTGQAAGYGALGSMYGSQAAGLAPQAQQYGANAANIGATGGLGYGAMGAQAGQNAAGIGTMGGMQYGQQGAQAGQAAGAIGTMAGLGYGAQGSQAGQQAAGYGAQGSAAGNAYGQNATNPSAVAAYMNPYLQSTLAPSLQLLNQQYGQQNVANQAAATQQGAFGGGRSAVMAGLNQQNQDLATNQLVSNAYNQAYNTANTNMQTAGSQAMQGAGLGITGQQAAISGANTGLSGANTALQGQQTNISGANTGLSGVNAGIAGQNAAMQGAGMGITGTNTAVNAQQAGLQGLGQAGTLLGQGMQGAQTGLQGVGAQQAGYAGIGAQATNLGNLAGAQTQTDLNIANAQQGAGATQQQNQQNILNQAMANYNTAQTMPMTQLAQLESMYTGAPQNITSSTYSAAPNTVSQLAGLGTTAVGAAKLAGAKKGGLPKEFSIKKMATGGISSGVPAPKLDALLGRLDDQQLALKADPKQNDPQTAQAAASQQAFRAQMRPAGIGQNYNFAGAGGGIVAFGEGGSTDDSSDLRARIMQDSNKTSAERVAEMKALMPSDAFATDYANTLKQFGTSGITEKAANNQDAWRMIQGGIGLMGNKSPFFDPSGAMPAIEGHMADVKGREQQKMDLAKQQFELGKFGYNNAADLVKAAQADEKATLANLTKIYGDETTAKRMLESARISANATIQGATITAGKNMADIKELAATFEASGMPKAAAYEKAVGLFHPSYAGSQDRTLAGLAEKAQKQFSDDILTDKAISKGYKEAQKNGTEKEFRQAYVDNYMKQGLRPATESAPAPAAKVPTTGGNSFDAKKAAAAAPPGGVFVGNVPGTNKPVYKMSDGTMVVPQ